MNRQGLIEFQVTSVPYDPDYEVPPGTRATTNFANLARDPMTRRSNIGRFLELVDGDLNRILNGSPEMRRHRIALEVLTTRGRVAGGSEDFPIPLSEVLRARVIDTLTDAFYDGPVGMNFSSHLRDYDFRRVLPELLPDGRLDGFGRLHGYLCRMQFGASGIIGEPLVVAISISHNCAYRATERVHPILGREYTAERESITDGYFGHMGLRPRFLRPEGLPAPMAFYFEGNLGDCSDQYLAALIAVMANFQRIYRPEIYLSRRPFGDEPGTLWQASLSNRDHDHPVIGYDRDEREHLADQQADEVERLLLRPHADVIARLNALASAGDQGALP